MAHNFLPLAEQWSQGHHFPQQLERLCEHLKKRFPQAQWALTLSEQEAFSLEVLNQKVEQFEQTQSHQLDIEMILPSRAASASVLGLRWDDWVATAEQALTMAQCAQEDRWLRFPETELFDLSLTGSQALAQPRDLDPALLQESLLKLEAQALDLAPGVVRSDGASADGSYQRTSYCNSAGVQLLTPSTSFSRYLSLIAQDENGQETDYKGDFARDWKDLHPLDDLASQAVERTVSKLGKKKIPSGNYPVIFSERCSVSLIRCLLKALSGRLQYLKSTFLLDSLGQSILPDWATLSDNPRALDRFQQGLIDRDGLPTHAHQLIESGVIKEYLLSYYSATRLGLKPNSLASGLINMSLTTNAQSLDELVQRYPQCLVITGVSGTGINLMHGDYSQGAEGFFYANGQKVHALDEVTIASSLKDLFLSLEAHAADWERAQGHHIGSLAFPSMAVSCQ